MPFALLYTTKIDRPILKVDFNLPVLLSKLVQVLIARVVLGAKFDSALRKRAHLRVEERWNLALREQQALVPQPEVFSLHPLMYEAGRDDR